MISGKHDFKSIHIRVQFFIQLYQQKKRGKEHK